MGVGNGDGYRVNFRLTFGAAQLFVDLGYVRTAHQSDERSLLELVYHVRPDGRLNRLRGRTNDVINKRHGRGVGSLTCLGSVTVPSTSNRQIAAVLSIANRKQTNKKHSVVSSATYIRSDRHVGNRSRNTRSSPVDGSPGRRSSAVLAPSFSTPSLSRGLRPVLATVIYFTRVTRRRSAVVIVVNRSKRARPCSVVIADADRPARACCRRSKRRGRRRRRTERAA